MVCFSKTHNLSKAKPLVLTGKASESRENRKSGDLPGYASHQSSMVSPHAKIFGAGVKKVRINGIYVNPQPLQIEGWGFLFCPCGDRFKICPRYVK